MSASTIAILGGIGAAVVLVVYYVPKSGRTDEIEKKGHGTIPLYGECLEDTNCKGGTIIGAEIRCRSSRCVPMVKADGLINVYSTPFDLGLHKVCDRFYLMGEGGECSKSSQCDASGVIKDASDPTARHSIATSKYVCGRDNRCTSYNNNQMSNNIQALSALRRGMVLNCAEELTVKSQTVGEGIRNKDSSAMEIRVPNDPNFTTKSF